MPSIRCICIGAGAAGRAVLKALSRAHGFQCDLLIDRSRRGSHDLPIRRDVPKVLPDCELLLLAVQDRELPALVEELRHRSGPKPGVVAHLSAATPLAVLNPLQALGWQPALLHPLQSFPPDHSDLWEKEPHIPWWGLCGTEAATSMLSQLLDSLGAQYRVLDEKEQLAWHLSAVWVSNLLPALLEQALQLWAPERRGEMRSALLPIMSQTLRHQELAQASGQPAFSGPLRRGDTVSLRRHLDWLAEHGSTRAGLSYRLLSATLLELLESRGENPLAADPALRAELLALPRPDGRED